ncbi:unnamed protein product [Orchesella dallaii]|uniref:Uncharacterized protein n=1 Tax=Orchesella dallaii TaxID=48710 RepID=A0ABP1QKQ6_9HEXA
MSCNRGNVGQSPGRNGNISQWLNNLGPNDQFGDNIILNSSIGSGSGLGGVCAPSYNTSSSGSYGSPQGRNISLNSSGQAGLNGIGAPSFNTSSSGSNGSPAGACGRQVTFNSSGQSGLSGIGAPSFNTSSSGSNGSPQGRNISLNSSGQAGLNGIGAPSFNTSSSGSNGSPAGACGRQVTFNSSGQSGLSGIGAPSFNTSSSGSNGSPQGRNISLNSSGQAGLNGIGAPSFNTSSSGSNGSPAGACGRQVTFNSSGQSGLSGISAPGYNTSSSGSYRSSPGAYGGNASLNSSGQNGLSGIGVPSFNTSSSGSYRSAQAYGGNASFNNSGQGNNSGLDSMVRPNLNSTGNSGGSGGQSCSPQRPGDISRAAEIAFGSFSESPQRPRTPLGNNINTSGRSELNGVVAPSLYSSSGSSGYNNQRGNTPIGDLLNMNMTASGLDDVSAPDYASNNSARSGYNSEALAPVGFMNTNWRMEDYVNMSANGLNEVGLPSLNNSSGSSAYSQQRPLTPIRDNLNMNLTGSGIGSISPISYNTSGNSGQLPAGACVRTPFRSPNIGNGPSIPTSHIERMNCSGGSGLSGISQPSYASSGPRAMLGDNSNGMNASDRSGLNSVGAPSLQSSGGGTPGRGQQNANLSGSGFSVNNSLPAGSPGQFIPPRPLTPLGNMNDIGNGLSGVTAPSLNSSSNSSGSARPRPLTPIGGNLNMNLNGSGLSGIAAPSFNSSLNSSGSGRPRPLNGDNFNMNLTGSGLSGVSAPGYNSSSSSSPQAGPSGTCGRGIKSPLAQPSTYCRPKTPTSNTCDRGSCQRPRTPIGDRLDLDGSGGGLSGVSAPNYNSSYGNGSSEVSGGGFNYNTSGANGLSQVSAPFLNSSGGSGGQSYPAQISYGDNFNDASGSGINQVNAPDMNSTISTINSPASQNRTGLSGIFAPSLYNSPYEGDAGGPMTSTPCAYPGAQVTNSPADMIQFSQQASPNLIQFSPQQASPNLIQFSPQQSPNLIQFSPDRGTFDSSRAAELAFGTMSDGGTFDSSRAADLAFGNMSDGEQFGIRRLPDEPSAELENIVRDGASFLMNVSGGDGQLNVEMGSPVAIVPYNSQIGDETIDRLRWGSFEQNIINQQNESAEEAPQSQQPGPIYQNPRNNNFDNGGSPGGAAGGVMVPYDDPNTSNDSGYSTRQSGPSPNPLINAGNRLMRAPPGNSSRVFDTNKLKLWVMNAVTKACQGQCGKSPWECEEHILKFLMGVVTSWRNLYSRRNDGRYNFMNSNHLMNKSGVSAIADSSTSDYGTADSSSCSQ